MHKNWPEITWIFPRLLDDFSGVEKSTECLINTVWAKKAALLDFLL